VESHAEFLRLVTLDEALAGALKRDWRTAALSERERAMLGYVEKLTLRAVEVARSDLDELRSHGFDDRAVLQINLIASWFNYINRVADGLGVGRP
jgi:uncharacterized peroxidase-related enzyme